MCFGAVGQFKDLVESTEKDVPLCETLKKVLNFTAKGWEVARAHALRAVATDNRMRIWLQDDKMQTGLLFRCNLGRVDLDVPVGRPLPLPSFSHGPCFTLELVRCCLGYCPGASREIMISLAQMASKHPQPPSLYLVLPHCSDLPAGVDWLFFSGSKT